MEMKKIIVTEHAKRRIRQRLGIPYKGAEKHAREAFYRGLIIQPLKNNTRALIVYNNQRYVYALHEEHKCPVLLTTYKNCSRCKR